jgi:DNA-nicking Smr family endonuclease
VSFSVGDKVRFLNETGEGVIVKVISTSTMLIENQDGFEQLYKLNELVATKTVDSYQLDNRQTENEISLKINSQEKDKNELLFNRKFRNLDQYGNDEFIEIDLHIQALYDAYDELTPPQIISIQMNAFIRELNVAIQKKAKKLIVIHGKGKGVLKREISIELYQNYPELIQQDASFNEYGYGGATEILLSKITH